MDAIPYRRRHSVTQTEIEDFVGPWWWHVLRIGSIAVSQTTSTPQKTNNETGRPFEFVTLPDVPWYGDRSAALWTGESEFEFQKSDRPWAYNYILVSKYIQGRTRERSEFFGTKIQVISIVDIRSLRVALAPTA